MRPDFLSIRNKQAFNLKAGGINATRQHAYNLAQFGQRAINSMANVVPTPTIVHAEITAFFSRAATVRSTLSVYLSSAG
jgi:hypothetical protein